MLNPHPYDYRAIAPEWRYWPATRPVNLPQAIALSMNIDPGSLMQGAFGWKGFSDLPIDEMFNKRLDLLESYGEHGSEMLLSDFAAWAVSVNLAPLPDEIAAMVPKADNAAETKESGEQRRIRLRSRRDELKQQNVRGWQKKIAEEEGISVPRLKQLLSPSLKQPAKLTSPFALLKPEKAKKTKSAKG